MRSPNAEDGPSPSYLEVRASNEAAIGLYDRFGFAQIGVRKRYYDNPREDALVMILPL